MPIVILPSPLLRHTAGVGRIAASGSSAAEALRALESERPGLRGWILDERGRLREHVVLFVDGEKVGLDQPLGESDELYVVQAISGGAPADRAELLVSTRKGLIVLRGPRDGELEPLTRAFPGQEVEYAIRDPRSGTYLASVTHGQFGPRVYRCDDPAGEWEASGGPAFPEGAEAAVKRIWVIEPGVDEGVVWAGVAPAALFRSPDDGRTWVLNRSLWDDPTRPDWEGGAGGLALHSICPWPGEPGRLSVAMSAVGVWHTDDGGASWRCRVEGLVPRYLPEEARAETLNRCVHKLERSPVEPETFYLQFHGGVYRSDDAGETWIDIAGGLPADFGFPIVVHPTDPDRAWVIPLVADVDRVPPDGRLRVFETRDRGASWDPLERGLPSGDAWVTVLRQAFCHDGGDPLGLYFGTESGVVYGSSDGGQSWRVVAQDLPPVLAVRCA